MLTKKENNKNAIILLHEIYGANQFMEQLCKEYAMKGFDVFCPDLLHRKFFLYQEEQEAYTYFTENVGFECYKNIEALLKQLKPDYKHLFILGFSAGATIAWRCCESPHCNSIICCYGSRIRDYLELQPKCSVLLLFARQDSFDVQRITDNLQKKKNIEVHTLEASHGFMDPFSKNFSSRNMAQAKALIDDFLKRVSIIG